MAEDLLKISLLGFFNIINKLVGVGFAGVDNTDFKFIKSSFKILPSFPVP
jgi:hypothetical protein